MSGETATNSDSLDIKTEDLRIEDQIETQFIHE
jgi:hypothetical protein